jgi:Ycf66 protein N-terminus
MLSYILATIVGLGSVAFYIAAFFFPEVYRKGDFIWSGVGFFYALVLWFCAGQIGGAVLLGQTASVVLLVWLGWQTLKLRRETTPLAEQTSAAAMSRGMSPTAIAEQLTNIFQSGKKAMTPPAPSSVPEGVTDTAEVVSDAVTEMLETATEYPTPEVADEGFEPMMPSPPAEGITESSSSADDDDSPEAISSVFSGPEAMVEATPISPFTEIPESIPIATPQDNLETEEDLENERDQVASSPAPVLPPPTPSLQPKSWTFGLLTSLIDRLKGLLSKEKPQSPTPRMTAPSEIAALDEDLDFDEIEAVASEEAVVTDSEVVETVVSEEGTVSEEAVVTDSEVVETVVSEEGTVSEEAVVTDSEVVETVVSEEAIVTDSEVVETVVSEEGTVSEEAVVTDSEVVETVVSEEGTDSEEAVVTDSEVVETVETSDPVASEAIVSDENILEAEIFPEMKDVGVDETPPTPNKPQHKKKKR